MKISASAAHAIGERARWRVLESLPYVSDVLVRTRSTETVCPLLSRNQRDPASVERDVRAVVRAPLSRPLSRPLLRPHLGPCLGPYLPTCYGPSTWSWM